MTKRRTILMAGATALFLYGCSNIDEGEGHDNREIDTYKTEKIQPPKVYLTKIKIDVPSEKEDKAEAATLAPSQAEIAPALPIVAPQIAPFYAMYVNAYGLLPTRFQDKGPNLYSFDVSPEAAASPDNNLGPLDFFAHVDDDNGW